jgi:hypothetical protein
MLCKNHYNVGLFNDMRGFSKKNDKNELPLHILGEKEDIGNKTNRNIFHMCLERF